MMMTTLAVELQQVHQVAVDFRRYVFLSNVYLSFFSIYINYHIMNKQILLKTRQ